MTRSKRVVLTCALAAVLVPLMALLPRWCSGSAPLRSFALGLSSALPPGSVEPVMQGLAILAFALISAVFAWLLTRIWKP